MAPSPRGATTGLGVGLFVLCLLGSVRPAVAVDADWVDRWRSDIESLRDALVETHPDPFEALSQEDLAAELDRLSAALPALEHHEVVVELARIVARIGDGHTRVTLPLAEDSGFFLGHSPTALPAVPGLVFRPLPLRLQILDDGVFVESIATVEARSMGARVHSIGGRPIEAVIAAVAPVVHHDNPMQLRFQLPDYLILPEVLHARGVIDDLARVAVGLVDSDGEERTIQLEVPAAEPPIAWAPELPGTTGRTAPLYLRDRHRNYWFTYLDESRSVYWQYNEVGDGEGETLTAFAERLFAFLETEPVDRLIVDLRWNRGGSNGFNRPLLHHILRSDRVNQAGRLFVITGGGTFSAAMMFAVDLEKHTRALFVGEPTGSSPNHFGDSRKIRLPESGLTVRISTLYWQYSDPRDGRVAIEPHVAAPLRSVDVRSSRDPSLEAILDSVTGWSASDEGLDGSWRGRATIARAWHEIAVEIDRGRGMPKVLLSLPGFGVSDQAIETVQIDRASLSFEQALGDSLLFFRARREGHRLYGEIGEGPRAFPFVLERRGPARENAASNP